MIKIPKKLRFGLRSTGLKILAAALLLFLATKASFASAANQATVFYNQACRNCKLYLDEVLVNSLKAKGYEITILDYINDPSQRKVLNQWNKRWEIPISLQDNLVAFIDNRLVIEGHVPEKQVQEVLDRLDQINSPKLLLAQPKMHGVVEKVTLYNFRNKPVTISPEDSVLAALETLTAVPTDSKADPGYLAAVVAGGLANSLHPCGIAVLLVLVTFLYALRKSRLSILAIGFLYILGIFITYFLIGVGLVKTISLSDRPFFFAQLATFAAIILGLINLKDYFLPQLPLHLKIPDFTKNRIQKFIERASLPSAFGLGVLVGICAFPCTGGIYTVIITTLATAKTVPFYLYLLLYNLLFVLPLIIIVLLSGNQKVVERIEKLERQSARRLHLLTGVLMILLGAGIYLWLQRLR